MAVLPHISSAAPAPAEAQQPLGERPLVETAPRAFPVPFTPLPHHGAPLVYLRINGKEPATFLVDTGANVNLISESLATRLGLKTHPSPGNHDVASTPFGAPINQTDIPLVTLPVAEGTVTNTLDINLSHDPAAFSVAPTEQLQFFFVDGFLGAAFLRGGAVSFDFVTHNMGITGTGNLPPDQVKALGFGGADGATLPLTPCNGGCVSVPATLSDGRSSYLTQLEVDTGGSSTLIPLATAKELSLKSVGTEEIGGGSAGDKVLERVELPSLSLGKLRLSNLTVSTTSTPATPAPSRAGDDPPAHLGMDLLKNYRILIDYPAMVMYLQPNAPEEPLPQSTTQK